MTNNEPIDKKEQEAMLRQWGWSPIGSDMWQKRGAVGYYRLAFWEEVTNRHTQLVIAIRVLLVSILVPVIATVFYFILKAMFG